MSDSEYTDVMARLGPILKAALPPKTQYVIVVNFPDGPVSYGANVPRASVSTILEAAAEVARTT